MSIQTFMICLLTGAIFVACVNLSFIKDEQHAQTVALQQTAASMAQIATELAPLQVVGATLDDAAKPRGKR